MANLTQVPHGLPASLQVLDSKIGLNILAGELLFDLHEVFWKLFSMWFSRWFIVQTDLVSNMHVVLAAC